MKNRFKFRAWYYDKDDENDSDNNKMFYNAQDTYDCLGGNPPLRASSFGDIIDDERWVVEQCTGLKDKNGKLIYENDLIKCPSGIYRIAVDDFGLWTAIYKNNPFEGVYEWSNMVKEYAFNQNDVEIEVLGNIHENTNLLENEE